VQLEIPSFAPLHFAVNMQFVIPFYYVGVGYLNLSVNVFCPHPIFFMLTFRFMMKQ
jgi:hypothetical protein